MKQNIRQTLKQFVKGDVRGQFDNLNNLAVGGLVLGITMVVVFLVFSNLSTNSQVVADANATLSTATITNATADIVDWVPLVILAVIGGVLLSLVAFFRGRGR